VLTSHTRIKAEAEIEALTGMIVGHSTQQRLVNRQELHAAIHAKQAGYQKLVRMGKSAICESQKLAAHWKDYKVVKVLAILWCVLRHNQAN